MKNRVFTLKTQQMFSFHTTPEEFENGGFTLKTYQMFVICATPEEFKNVRFHSENIYQMFSVHTTPEEFEILSKCFPSTRKRRADVLKFLRFEKRF